MYFLEEKMLFYFQEYFFKMELFFLHHFNNKENMQIRNYVYSSYACLQVVLTSKISIKDANLPSYKYLYPNNRWAKTFDVSKKIIVFF